MDPLDGRLAELARKLDALGPTPALVELAEALESSRLARADVERFARPNPHHYNRALTISRERYEVLVMTWLPGQASVPHDHAGSMCLMQVLEGEAAEGNYRIGPDGYVDLDFETPVRAGQITSGQDQGVHTVRNASAQANRSSRSTSIGRRCAIFAASSREPKARRPCLPEPSRGRRRSSWWAAASAAR